MTEPTKYAQDGKTPLSEVRKALEWVKERITESPEQYDQRSWGSCETVGCIAGWLDCYRNGVEEHMARFRYLAIPAHQVRSIAKRALGVHNWTNVWLFDAELIPFGVTDEDIPGIACGYIDRYLEEIGA